MSDYPNINQDIDFRIRDFQLELHELEKTLSDFYFSVRELSNNVEENDRLWNHYEIKKMIQNDKITVGFRFLTNSSLNYKLKEMCFEIFKKHFPNDGIEGSLTGYPQQF